MDQIMDSVRSDGECGAMFRLVTKQTNGLYGIYQTVLGIDRRTAMRRSAGLGDTRLFSVARLGRSPSFDRTSHEDELDEQTRLFTRQSVHDLELNSLNNPTRRKVVPQLNLFHPRTLLLFAGILFKYIYIYISNADVRYS